MVGARSAPLPWLSISMSPPPSPQTLLLFLTADSISYSVAALLAQARLRLPPPCPPIPLSHRRHDRLSSWGCSTGCPPTALSAASCSALLLLPSPLSLRAHSRRRPRPRHHRPATDSPPQRIFQGYPGRHCSRRRLYLAAEVSKHGRG